jgi:small subunit ribosomal protein S5e
MADEDWGDVQVAPNVDSAPLQIAAELPEVKLFGRWSCDDVEVSDMSLQVCLCLILSLFIMFI